MFSGAQVSLYPMTDDFAMFVLRCLSGALLGGWLGHVIVEALYKTGALAGLAIDYDRRSALA
jgi:energy-coupling factor transport system substrate-specific component